MEHQHNTEENKSAVKKSTVGTPAAIMAAAVIIALAIVYTHFAPTVPAPTIPTGGQQAPAGNKGATPPTVNIKNVKIDGEPFVGEINAPVTIAYWSDYQCPFCKKFELDTLPKVMDAYVKTGKVKIVFKDFQFLGNDSITGALYDRAVWDLYPTQYFEWRTAMYTNQDQEGDQGFGNETSVKQLTATILGSGAADKVAATVKANNAKYLAEIDADKQEGSDMGITGTPGFVIGTQAYSGYEPYTQFSSELDAVLK